MINTTNDIRGIMMYLGNMCTDNVVKDIILRAREDITAHLTKDLPEPNEEERQLLEMDQNVKAINSFRLRTGCGLKEARYIIDKYK
jgi:ribosomal protein L7/L12